MRRSGLPALLTAFLLLFPFSGWGKVADVFPDVPDPPRLVNDLAGVFPPGRIDSLERALVAFDDSTSNQICVVTVADLHGYDVAEYALRLANRWGVGSNRNNGVIVLLKPRGTDRYVDVTIQVGRGLEGAITDVYASRIIRGTMGPHLVKDEYFPAVSKACAQLMALACGEISEPRKDEDEGAIIAMIVVCVLAVIFLLALLYAASKEGGSGPGGYSGGGSGPVIFWGNRPSSSGSGWSGGFGGGGFGGFGGGSFGGGGASGRF